MNIVDFFVKHRPDKDCSFVLSRAAYVYLNHTDFVNAYKQDDFDFVYDAATGIYFRDVVGDHVSLMADLYRFYFDNVEGDDYTVADRYILESHGMFKSKAGQFIYHGASFQVPPIQYIQRDLQVI